MGLFSFIGGMIGAGKQKKASRKAEAAMLEYLQKAIDQQNAQYKETRQDFAPYREAGVNALGGYQDLMGANGSEAQQSSISALMGTPMWSSLVRNGEESILANASATGGLRGGNTNRSLADFRSDTLAQEVDRQLARYGGLINGGQSATGSVAGLGAQNAMGISQLLSNQGQARAGGLLTRGGITAGMWNSAGGFADNAVSAFMPGGGGLKSLF